MDQRADESAEQRHSTSFTVKPTTAIIFFIYIVGLNFTMNMTWEGLVGLRLSKKQPENNFHTQGVPVTCD